MILSSDLVYYNMLINIFSNFDPIWFNLCYKNFVLITLIIFTLISIFWVSHRKIILSIILPIKFIERQLNIVKLKSIKNLQLTIVSIFLFLIYINVIGMAPYSFRVRSHIIFTLSLSIPIWILLIIRSIIHSIKNTMAHILPDSAPLWLNPFLRLIELIRVRVRPLTLSFRLAANITAGHIILILILTFSTLSVKILFVSATISYIYTIFELIICIIQAYILCLLLSLYSNDHV